jgi:hypothetical protein
MLPEERFRELRFEDLVADPAGELSKITDFLGVGFEDGMLADYSRKASDKVGDKIHQHHTHLSRPPSASQAGKWRQTLSPADQAVAFEIAGPLLTELGYPDGVKSHPLKIFRKGYHRLKESYQWRSGKKAPQ